MTRMIDSLAQRPAPQRILIAALLSMLGLFLAAMTIGIIVAFVEKGWPSRPWVLAIPLVAVPLAFVLLKSAWRLAFPPGSSGYERRYWNAWLLIVLIAAPIGVLSSLLMIRSGMAPADVFSAAPIPVGVAATLAALITIVGIAALILYHRAVDDHEERAYLWGSQLAYYFLVVAFPAWWLLERGGVVPPIDTAIAFVAILLSFVVQAAVWAWLKFR